MQTKKILWSLMMAGLLAACSDDDGGLPDMHFTTSISECGGFNVSPARSQGAARDYCDAEMLYWSYDEATQVLSLWNTRVLLNCCGEHGITASWQGSRDDLVLVVDETDAPLADGGRCRCMCVFDYSLQVRDAPPGQIRLVLSRTVTDDPEASGTKVEATVDLAQGSGAILVDDQDASAWCDQR